MRSQKEGSLDICDKNMSRVGLFLVLMIVSQEYN